MAKKKKEVAAPAPTRACESRFSTGYTPADGVTQSILGAFCDCRKRCQLMLEGLRPEKPKRAQEYGSLTHLLLERWYGPKPALASPEHVFAAVEKEWRAAALKKGDDLQAVEKDLAMASAVFPAYCRHWEKKDAKMDWVALEEKFDVRYGSDRLRGKTDGVFRTKQKKLWLFETKTKSRIDVGDISEALAFDFQSLFYLSAQEALKGERIHGVMYNVVRVPQLKEDEESDLRAYAVKIAADVAKKPEHYFHRFECPFPRDRVGQFGQELLDKLELFRRWCAGDEDEPTYRNEAACCARWNCDYLHLCASGSESGYKTGCKLFEELA